MPKILVVIPTLSRPETCRRAVGSLLKQTFTDWSLVVAKNGGRRGFHEYVTALDDVMDTPRAHFVIFLQSGLGYALNEAVSQFVEGHDYFANLEDDDEWDPDFLKTMYREARRTQADVVNCLQRQIPVGKQSSGGQMDEDDIYRHNWINFPMCLFRANLFERADGFCNEAGPATDWDWHLRCLSAGARYHFVPEVLVTHHWHGDNYCIKEDGAPQIRQWIREGRYERR